MKKKFISILLALVLVLVMATPVMAAKGGGGGINDPPGNPLFVIIEVTWDGDLTDGNNDGCADSSTWTVWGPAWAPVVGGTTILAGPSTDALDMSGYTFTFHGKTVHFDEAYVSGVDACPQVHHVVLHDKDGDLTYTGSDPASKYTFPPSRPDRIGVFHDRIDYEITFDSISGSVTHFRYLEYEHWNAIPKQ
ncbi:hypothetical protein ES703_109850 [subsurface metagenome]